MCAIGAHTTAHGQAVSSFYYETRYVGANTGGEDFLVLSAEERNFVGFPPILSGLFADFSVGGLPAVRNTAAVLDGANYLRTNGRFHPTGQMVVAKEDFSGTGVIETYFPVNWNANYLGRQDLPGATPQYDNTVPLWQFTTASGAAAQAVDIATGRADPAGPLLFRTQFLITAEPIAGVIWIAAYAMNDAAGNVIQPFLVNGVSTGVTGTCLGLTTSPGRRIAPLSNDRTLNEVVFAIRDATGNVIVDSVTFDIRTMLFNTVPTSYALPANFNALNVTGNSVAGIWIAHETPHVTPSTYRHHVAVSVPNPANPTGAPGTLLIWDANGTGPVIVPNVGGGPISHVPWGHNMTATMGGGPAHFTMGFNLPLGPTGWYVVTPGGLGQRALVDVYDPAGAYQQSIGWYPFGAIPNGPPLGHPASRSVTGLTSEQEGVVWMPYSIGGTAFFELGNNTGQAPVVTAQASIASPSTQNFPSAPQGVLPKPVGSPWPTVGTGVILPDQKTNFKVEYALYIIGY